MKSQVCLPLGHTSGTNLLRKSFAQCCCYCCWVASVMSNSVWPHRRQPTRLLCPWDSPGKNTGVGCHFLLQCMKVKSEVTQSCPTFSDLMDCSPPGSFIHGIFQARVLQWGATAFSNTATRRGQLQLYATTQMRLSCNTWILCTQAWKRHD